HAGLIVDEHLQILHFRGAARPYMAPAAGAASLHLLKMLRGDLLVDLRAAFHQSKKENTAVRKEGIRVTSGGRSREVCLDVVPLSAPEAAGRHFLILFEDTSPAPIAHRPSKPIGKAKGEIDPAVKLQQELMATREYLQAIIEE